jgi:hypothetical protein
VACASANQTPAHAERKPNHVSLAVSCIPHPLVKSPRVFIDRIMVCSMTRSVDKPAQCLNDEGYGYQIRNVDEALDVLLVRLSSAADAILLTSLN